MKVEEIAAELCHGTRLIELAMHKAREPLINALRSIAFGGNRPVDELRSIAAAALDK